METRKVRSVAGVILQMIIHGWWSVQFHGHESYMSSVSNTFGRGFWSWRKFAMCGKVLSGNFYRNESGNGRMFHAHVWEFQEMFLTRKVYTTAGV